MDREAAGRAVVKPNVAHATGGSAARWRLVAALLLPPLAAAAFAATALARRHAPGMFDASSPPADIRSLVEAVGRSDLATVHAAIRAGLDANQRGPYRNVDLFGRRTVHASPLFVAVAVGDAPMVRLLLGAGLELTRLSNREAACVGQALRRNEELRLLALAGLEPMPIACAYSPVAP